MANITLTQREEEVAALVAAGLTNREIAGRLSVAERTAEYHVEQIRNKLGFRSRVHIAAWFMEREKAGPHVQGNVPVQLTSFVGRAREMVNVQRLLVENRLVSIAGPPGMGKTRLALQVARTMGSRFRDGSWLIELGPISDGKQVASALAAALRVAEQPGEDVLATVASALRQRRALLVIDNCEHLLDAAAASAEALLRACPEIRILTTTRQPLRATGEFAYRIPPLAEAERLFYERAVQSVPDFELTPAVTAICRDLEGLPLAIELAAARVSQMSAEDLAAGLNRSLHLLTSGFRTAARRQQSLNAAIEWSHELLTRDERLVFARLSVFVGGFSLSAAEAVCGEGLREVGDLVLALTDKSMVSTMARAGRSTRYRLLEALRQFAAERLVEAAELDRAQRRHFDFYVDWAAFHSTDQTGNPYAVDLDRVEEELGNIRAALEWSRAQEPEGHLRLAAATSHFWLTRGSIVEGLAWLEPALAASTGRSRVRADALWCVAMLASRHGDTDASRSYNWEAIGIYRQFENWGHLARVLNNLAVITDDPAAADRLLVEGLDCARRSQQPGAIALLLTSRGEKLRAAGQTKAARETLEEALALRRVEGFEWGLARALVSVAHLALDEGEQRSARLYLEEALEIVRALEDAGSMAVVLEAFALSSADPYRALRLAGCARGFRNRAGEPNRSVERRDVEEHLRSARNELGAQAAAIEAAGQVMSLDEAIADALSD
jgi:non-specific serine/threonine protein kinase